MLSSVVAVWGVHITAGTRQYELEARRARGLAPYFLDNRPKAR